MVFDFGFDGITRRDGKFPTLLKKGK